MGLIRHHNGVKKMAVVLVVVHDILEFRELVVSLLLHLQLGLASV